MRLIPVVSQSFQPHPTITMTRKNSIIIVEEKHGYIKKTNLFLSATITKLFV
jgi:hypothetical protein